MITVLVVFNLADVLFASVVFGMMIILVWFVVIYYKCYFISLLLKAKTYDSISHFLK